MTHFKRKRKHNIFFVYRGREICLLSECAFKSNKKGFPIFLNRLRFLWRKIEFLFGGFKPRNDIVYFFHLKDVSFEWTKGSFINDVTQFLTIFELTRPIFKLPIIRL